MMIIGGQSAMYRRRVPRREPAHLDDEGQHGQRQAHSHHDEHGRHVLEADGRGRGGGRLTSGDVSVEEDIVSEAAHDAADDAVLDEAAEAGLEDGAEAATLRVPPLRKRGRYQFLMARGIRLLRSLSPNWFIYVYQVSSTGNC